MIDPMRKEYRVLSGSEKYAMAAMKALAEDLFLFLESLGSTRELSLSKTKLEECVMWAVKSITGPKT